MVTGPANPFNACPTNTQAYESPNQRHSPPAATQAHDTITTNFNPNLSDSGLLLEFGGGGGEEYGQVGSVALVQACGCIGIGV